MALTFISEDSTPAYIALSSDIEDGTIDGISLVGKLLLTVDDGAWYIVAEDLTLVGYSLPVNVGTIEIGTVSQGNPGLLPWLVEATGGVAIADGANLDAFSRLRVSLPKVIFNSTFKYDLDPYQYWQSTVTGGWTSANANSGVEYHPVITAVTGGTVVYSYFIPSSNSSRGAIQNKAGIKLPIVLDIDGLNPISLVVCATSLSSTSACRCRITWKELR